MWREEDGNRLSILFVVSVTGKARKLRSSINCHSITRREHDFTISWLDVVRVGQAWRCWARDMHLTGSSSGLVALERCRAVINVEIWTTAGAVWINQSCEVLVRYSLCESICLAQGFDCFRLVVGVQGLVVSSYPDPARACLPYRSIYIGETSHERSIALSRTEH